MGRVPYVKPGTSKEVDDLFKEIAGMGRPVLNLYRALANQPPALAAFLENRFYLAVPLVPLPQLVRPRLAAPGYLQALARLVVPLHQRRRARQLALSDLSAPLVRSIR